MAKQRDEYDEFLDTDDTTITHEALKAYRVRQKDAKKQAAEVDVLNEVGIVPLVQPEDDQRRILYESDYVQMHRDIFTNSTGMKPFGPIQVDSVNRTLHVLKHGGRSVIAEPRGFGKTSRTANNALMAILQGRVKYVLILASSVSKAEDILEAIKTEVIDNQELFKIYPATCACFEHIGENANRGRNQTYLGEKTFISFTKTKIRFPTIPGEPSSGSIIQIRTKDNVRGLSIKIRYGLDSGKILRPDFVFLDDIQTDEEAESPTAVYKIIQTLKKSVLFAGSHAKPISALMCCTPICPGDVSSHFILNEPSWDYVLSKMIPKMPDRMDLWLTEYSRILLDFNRNETGSRLKARLRAREYVEKNYDTLHAGSEVAWDWAYAWLETPPTEVSALQHAMNFLIENGPEAFESECQCNVMPRYDESEGIKVTIDEILNKLHEYPRFYCPVETKYVVTHIDVNKNILTYSTVCSAQDFRPMLIDLGEHPKQQGAIWKKRDIVYTLGRHYPDVPEDQERIYVGLKDLINKIGKQEYKREDGLIMNNNLIIVDMGYEIDQVQRAIRDSEFKNICVCYRGQGIRAQDKPFMDRHYEKGSSKHFHCATVPTTDKLLTVLYTDVNYFKTAFHKGIRTRYGVSGSFSLFTPERTGQHLLLARQCLVEIPTSVHDDKKDITVIEWSNPNDDDNEHYDNIVGCFAGLFKLGCDLVAKKRKAGTYSIQEYIDKQKKIEGN